MFGSFFANVQRLLRVGRLLRQRDAVRLCRLRLVAVLGDPDRHRAVEPLLQIALELRHRRERHVRVAHLLHRREIRRRRVRVMGPRVELQPLHLREQMRERARRDGRADTRERLVAPARRGLADRDLGQRVARLDPGVGRLVELRVVRGADDLLARRTAASGRAAGSARSRRSRARRSRARCARCSASRASSTKVVRSLSFFGMHVRRLAAVRPLRRAGDVDHHAQVVEPRLEDEVVEVVQLVGRVVAVRRHRQASSARSRPRSRSCGSRMRPRTRQAARFCSRAGRPAERRVVEEADRHPLCGMHRGGRDGE